MIVFVFSYILAGLSPADTNKIFAELAISILEILFVLSAIVIAIIAGNKRFDTITHSIHSQGLSYKKIFLAHRLVGATVLLYLSVVMCGGLFIFTLFGISTLGIGFVSLYLLCRLLLLYTIVFVISHHIAAIIAGVFGLVLYLLFYSVGLIQSRSQGLGKVAQLLIDSLVYVTPYFVSIGQNSAHMDWLSANIFTIVISYGIYIVFLLAIGTQSYTKIRWK